ncbi:fido domain-containing protein [Hypoxylon sp. FL1150]|nr:fido domain-containing protein [Hypoxylon sp. FL1150]
MSSPTTDLEITSTRAPSNSPPKHANMKKSLRDTISKGWPSMSQNSAEVVSMTIHTDDIYRQYARDQDPKELFEKAANWISQIRITTLDDKQQELINEQIHEAMVRAIFGSNMIEHAGLGYDITIQLCRKIFAGEDVGEISERSLSYQNDLLELYSLEPGLKGMPVQNILRGRNEIVQHAKAFQHIIHAFVAEKQDLTEDLIKDTHRILTKGIPISHQDGSKVSPEEYGGIYRTVIVGAGSTNFTVPKFVPVKMKEMCENLKGELAAAEEKKMIDPFSIATKYSLEFVSIHPFQDGNGRLCRMILNAILCRYAGVIVPIGERGEEREEYMSIKKRSSETMEGHGEYATFVLRRAFTRLRDMKKKLTGKGKGKSVTSSDARSESTAIA